MDISVKPSRQMFWNISSFQALAMFRRGLFYSYLSIYLRFYLGLSVTETTLFGTFPMVLNVVFQTFVWGVVSDKYQRRRTLIILGEVLAAIGTIGVWYFHTLADNKHAAGYVIIIGLSLVEIFWSMSNIGWSALISDLYPEKYRTGLQGRLASVGALGRIVGVLVGGLAYDGLAHYYEGWGFDKGLLFFVASGVMLVSTIPMFFVPEGGIHKTAKGAHQRHETRILDSHEQQLSRVFWFFLLAMIFINFGRNSIAAIKTQYLFLDQGFNVSSRLLSYVVNMESLAILVMGLFIAQLSRHYRDFLLLFLGAVAAIMSLSGYALANSLPFIFPSNFLAGVSEVLIFAASYSYVSRLIPPEQRGRQFALFNATYFLSWGVGGTLVAGPIIDSLLERGVAQVPAYKVAFLSSTVLVVIGMVVLFATEQMNRRISPGLKKIPAD